jgi:deoxyribodipyrimidine photolyase-related protein
MREYKDTLIGKGINVHYNKLENLEVSKSYFDNFDAFLEEHNFNKISIYEIEDKLFEEESINYFNGIEKEIEFIRSPMFLFSREELREFQGDSSKYRMANFYKKSRQRLNLLVDEEGNPEGGKWSFDEDNRKKFPKDIELPTQPSYQKSKHHDDIIQIIEKYFSDHPGLLENFWFPVTREQANKHFKNFL